MNEPLENETAPEAETQAKLERAAPEAETQAKLERVAPEAEPQPAGPEPEAAGPETEAETEPGPEESGAELTEAELAESEAELSPAELSEAEAELTEAELTEAELTEAELTEAELTESAPAESAATGTETQAKLEDEAEVETQAQLELEAPEAETGSRPQPVSSRNKVVGGAMIAWGALGGAYAVFNVLQGPREGAYFTGQLAGIAFLLLLILAGIWVYARPPAVAAAKRPTAPPSPIVEWVKRQPFFAAFLLFIVLGSPYLVFLGYRIQLEQRLTRGLDQWEANLSAAGLPVPFLAKVRAEIPMGLTEDLAAFEKVQLAERYRALQAWSDVLSGEGTPDLSSDVKGLGAAVRACLLYRRAAQVPKPPEELLARALQDGERAPAPLRPTLRLVHKLLAGQHLVALEKIEERLKRKPPAACRPALEALHLEARGRVIRDVLRTRPPPRTLLDKLIPKQKEESRVLRAALLQEGANLAGLLVTGPGDLHRARVLVGILKIVFPEGVGEGTPFASAWPAVRVALGEVLKDHLSKVEDDPNPALDVLGRVARLDPSSDLPPPDTFNDWRLQLQEVVDSPRRLYLFTLRFLEVGRLPLGLDEIFLSHFVRREGTKWLAKQPVTPGAVLAHALVDHLEKPREDLAQRVAEQDAGLKALLAGRRDPAAKRIQALGAYLQGGSLLRANKRDAARVKLTRAEQLGFEPRHQLLALQADLSDPVGRMKERATLLDTHAKKLEAGVPKVAQQLAWELAGYPVDFHVMNPLRARAHLDLAERVLNSDLKQAAHSAAQALALLPQSARANLVQALVFQAQGRKRAARQAAFWGLRAARPDEAEVRKRIRALLQKLGPN